ncbi:MFS transporter [Sphingobium chungbukense]|uniref:Major facilitator superfamily (MFS) profile domain-containing protein n=1 Tax=Sphingobium chungbukense TaxID=56193 RepID=A0A0M3AT94_9SPHN|nr:MFS transporter [Sphingobium chungbukense]KKW91734.1 hypothetical protein YP76_11395 [Sphingobium chungbukense]
MTISWPSARQAWTMTAVLTFAYTIAFLHRIGLSLFVEPIRADFHLTDTQVGLLTGACFALPYTLFAPLSGWLVDRFNRCSLLAGAGLIWSAATGFGIFSYAILMIGRIVTGAVQSIVQPGSASLIADMFHPDKRAAGYGVFAAGTAFGTAGAYFAGALAVSLSARWADGLGLHEWQVAMLLFGSLGLFIPLALLCVREPVRQELSEEAVTRGAVIHFVRGRIWTLATLFGGVAIAFLAMYGQLAFMPSLFIRKYGWTADDVAVTFGGIAAVVGALGSFSVGPLTTWLAGRGNNHASWTICLFGTFACLAPGALAPIMPTGALCMTMFAISGAFANFPAVAVLAVISEITPNELRGQLTALYTALVGLCSAALGPLVVGLLNDNLPGSSPIDLSLSWTFAGCAILSAGLLIAGMPGFRRLKLGVLAG